RLLAFHRRRVGEDVAARQLDVALLRQPLDELPRDDFLDRARGALHLDAVIALEQRGHFLARRPEQLRDLEDPNSCQKLPLNPKRATRRWSRPPIRRAPRRGSSLRSCRRCRESPTAARPTPRRRLPA